MDTLNGARRFVDDLRGVLWGIYLKRLRLVREDKGSTQRPKETAPSVPPARTTDEYPGSAARLPREGGLAWACYLEGAAAGAEASVLAVFLA